MLRIHKSIKGKPAALLVYFSAELTLGEVIALHDHPRLTLLNAKLNPVRNFLALLGAHHILHVSRIRVKDNLNCLGLPSNFPFGVTTLNALLDSPATVAPPERGAPDSLSSFRSPALEGATLAGRTRPVAGELEGGGSCRDFTVMLKSRGIGTGTDTSIALIRVQIAKGNSVLVFRLSHYLHLSPPA